MHLNNSFLNIKKTELMVFLIIISSFLIDKFYVINISYLPAWDQGYHLANLFRTYNLLENFSFNNQEWWHSFWSISETYRGPLTYIFSSIFLKFFGNNYESSILSNNIFTAITILCIFNLCRELGYKKAGLWGAFIFAFNSYIFDQRVDYLIDISQICFLNLNFYILFKFFKSNGTFLLSLVLGITLGFLFLTKPTGIFFLVFPYLYTFYLLIKNFNLNKLLFLALFLATFITTIWPWLSINWLTIITSIVNSWQWGIKYQEGLEANTLGGILFYPKTIIKLIGPTISGSFFVIASLKILRQLKDTSLIKKFPNLLNKNTIFLLCFPVNILVLCTLMSTKDLRFILPIFPSLCVLSGLFLTNLKNYNWVKIYKIFIILIILLKLFLNLILHKNIFFKFDMASNANWPHKEIIEQVNRYSPNSKSVIAILPDTKELNTFNLASEANLQNSNVYIRQIISNEKSYKEDLDRFNWFLLKNGDQGEMFNNSKLELSNLIKQSNKFQNFRSWELPDGTQATLYKRKRLNESISIIKSFTPLDLDLIFSSYGITTTLKGSNEILSNSNLLLDVKNNDKLYEINIAFPKTINISNENIEIIKNIDLEDQFNFDQSFTVDPVLISYKNEQIPVQLNKVIFNNKEKKDNTGEFQINKIKELEIMGRYLKIGEFDKLFNLVGLVNQSDPNQEYLKDAEKIFKFRYQLNKNNYDYLYNIAISQILQRKSTEAANTLKNIMRFDRSNPNLYLAKSVVDIYNLHPRQADKNIQIASKLNNKENLYSTINTIKLISDILNFKIRTLINI